MKNTFTPGPWYWANYGDSEMLISETKHRPVVLCAGKGVIMTSVDGILNPVSNDNANARLIAAAPELLHALKDVVYFIENPDDNPPVKEWVKGILSQANEAIAKAEGAQP